VTEAARLYAARDCPAAATVCRAIILADPHHFDARNLLGVLLTGREQHGAAANAFGQAIPALGSCPGVIRPRHHTGAAGRFDPGR
jgi:hypothetical protein